MTLLFKSDIERHDTWLPALQKHLPDREIRLWPEVGEKADIEYALVWEPPEGFLATLPNLKAIFSIGAGIDHIVADRKRPAQLPVVRMVEEGLTAGMTEFVLMQVLYHHRLMLDYRAQAAQRLWREIPAMPAGDRRVGILGLGVLGQDAAAKLATLGFDVAGWSRTPKEVAGVACYHGPDGLDAMLARSDILVCLLPLTPETRGILNAQLFAKLPRGACLINVGRGAHQVETDILAALDSGQLKEVSLDVFETEPLPADSPLWEHPRVVMTPHIASMTVPDTAARSVAENIARIESGQPPLNVVDFERGY
ncbi:2-hydroxyacid dehydrogenase [Aquibaculum sediminis]|uniref:2-hydroxyacid dehydrogenase n=1 Tax=Aquibaculum sediminis TaxID=3231907 RepID=UPI0034573A54